MMRVVLKRIDLRMGNKIALTSTIAIVAFILGWICDRTVGQQLGCIGFFAM